MGWSVNPEYKQLDKPWVEHHDTVTTKETIKEILKAGTPRWYSHPEEFKNYAIEAMQEEKEISNDMVLGYKIEDQEQLIDFKARNVNIISTIEFLRKLKDNGVRCFASYAGMPQTVGLWAYVPSKTGDTVRYITYMQIPAMIEWSVLRLDAHNLPNGEDYRGWRTVVSELIKKKVLTERRAMEIFGNPTDSIVSRRYRRTLHEYRHRKRDVAVRDGA